MPTRRCCGKREGLPSVGQTIVGAFGVNTGRLHGSMKRAEDNPVTRSCQLFPRDDGFTQKLAFCPNVRRAAQKFRGVLTKEARSLASSAGFVGVANNRLKGRSRRTIVPAAC
jgi:hypothetical protein